MRDAERLEQLRQDAERKEKAARDQEDDRTGRRARSESTTARRARPRTGPAPRGTSSPQALREAADTSAGARCAQQHRAALAALDGRRLGRGTGRRAERRRRRPHGEAAYLDAAEAPAAAMLAVPGATPRPSPTGRNKRPCGWASCWKSPRNANGSSARRRHEEGRLSAEVQAAADRVTAADQAVAERMRLLLDAYRSYLSGLAELRVADPDELIAALEGWGMTGEGANPRGRDHRRRRPRRPARSWANVAGELSTQRTRACHAGGRARGGNRPAAHGRPRCPAGPAHAGRRRPRWPSRRAAVEGDRLRAGPVR